MPVDRTRWIGEFKSLGWPCPSCGHGHMAATKQEAVMTGNTQRCVDEDWFDPEMAVYRFTSLLICQRPECKEASSVAGLSRSEFFQDHTGEYDQIDYYTVTSIHPSPFPFPVHPKVPDELREKLQEAANLYWVDTDAAANKIRSMVELFLTLQGVRRYALAGGKGRKTITLHARIQLYQKTKPEIADYLLAVKWIGNGGSHEGGLNQEAVLLAFEVIEHVLNEVYGKHAATLKKRVASVNKKKRA